MRARGWCGGHNDYIRSRGRLDGVGHCRRRDSRLGGYPQRACLGFMARLPTTEARTDLTPIEDSTRLPGMEWVS